jgi:cbb3-type cytochrome oxidase maturation protein
MSVIIVLIVVSFGMALCFLVAFLWAIRNNQFEDTFTPSLRILSEENQLKCEPEIEKTK